MALDHSVIPFEDESGLYSLLILTQFLHKSPYLRDTRMKSGMKPLIQFFPSAISQHLGKLLEQRIETMHVRMDLADLPQRHAFFIREVESAAKHQTHCSTGRQFDRGCHLTDFDSLLLHTAQTQEKSLNRHA